MAIAFDVAANGTALPGSTVTFSHTCTGSNLVLVVFVAQFGGGADDVTGVTYNSVSMTRASTTPTGGLANARGYFYILKSPSTGAHNVVVSLNNGNDFVRAFSASYTGGDQTTQPDANSTNTAAASSISSSIITIHDSDWVVTGSMDATAGNLSAGTNVTLRSSLGGLSAIGDSNAAISPPASYSQTWNASGSDNLAMLQLAINTGIAISQGGSSFLLNMI